jgi:hypothetical protein
MPRKMHTKMIAILIKIASIMLVLGMFATAVAYAETPREHYQDANDKYQTVKDRLNTAQESFRDSQEKFQDAKDRFDSERSLKNTEELKETLRNYLNRTIDYTIKRLEALQIRAEGPEENGFAPFIISDNIIDYSSQLEDLKDDVEVVETSDDFQAVIREVKSIWQNVHLESRYFIVGTLNNKVDALLERTDSIADRNQAEIDRLDEAGEDTKELKDLLHEYRKALDDAKDSHDDANKLFEEHDGFNGDGELQNAGDARAFLADAATKMRVTNQNLKEANSILRQIFNELKNHRPGSVSLSGTGSLKAEGDGKATLSGNLQLTVSAQRGILTINDYDEDAIIEIDGKGTKEVLDDGTIKYEGFDGTATISGSSITVQITGSNIELNAEGTGSAVLRGQGSYNVGPVRERFEWANASGETVQTRLQVENQNNITSVKSQVNVTSQFGNQSQTKAPIPGQVNDQPGGI